MTTETRYRITGDIIIKPKILVNGRHRDRKVDVSYANGSRTNLDDVAIIQARQPLTPHTPYFLLQIQKCGKIFKYLNLKRLFKQIFRSQCNLIDWYCTNRY
jgi:hypothetical protein